MAKKEKEHSYVDDPVGAAFGILPGVQTEDEK
jgi:hypothetical protein